MSYKSSNLTKANVNFMVLLDTIGGQDDYYFKCPQTLIDLGYVEHFNNRYLLSKLGKEVVKLMSKRFFSEIKNASDYNPVPLSFDEVGDIIETEIDKARIKSIKTQGAKLIIKNKKKTKSKGKHKKIK